MPYGIPWTSITGYRCMSCKQINDATRYMPYCGWCGAKQPEEKRAYGLGLAVPGATSGKESTRDLKTINTFIQQHHGKPIRLWGYHESHCELELRLRHSGVYGNSEEPWRNTVIYCAATRSIQDPTSEWKSTMVVEACDDAELGTLYTLIDAPSNVRIESGMLAMYFDVAPGI
jgi:hypothetical protein